MTNAEVSATQECTQTQTQYYTQSQWESQQTIAAGETRNPWGRIYVQRMRPNIPENESSTQCGLHEYHPEGTDTFHDLFEEEWKVGRLSGVDFTITKNEIPEQEIVKLSKVHFIVRRDLSHPLNPPILEDTSTNGTFVSQVRLGKGKCRVLRNGDTISILSPKFHLFRFMDLHFNCMLDLPQEIAANYYVGAKLGAGGCGEVTKVFNVRTCMPYAMKIVKKCRFSEAVYMPGRQNNSPRIHNEIEILRKLRHPCVIGMHEIIDRPDAVYMFLELMNGGDLCHRITTQEKKYLSEDISRLYFLQTCYAVKYLHDNKITHRDIKPDNILLATHDMITLVKVTDFGLSKFVRKDSIMKTMCGTPQYVAPEVLHNDAGAYTEKVDIWSLGVMLYTCLCGDFPFVIRNNRRQVTSNPRFKDLTKAAQVLIFDCLRTKVEIRPTITSLLSHKWLQNRQTIFTAQQLMRDHIQLTSLDTDTAPPRPPITDTVTATTPIHELPDEQFMEPPAKRIRVDIQS
uniref:Protein kinase domain-containing protein n=1 Tax=Phlebotomus papatasi TaxID=29031 RepID=A0A1B0D8G2_PHLPP